MSKDYAKLKTILGLLRPGWCGPPKPQEVRARARAVGASATPIRTCSRAKPGPEVDRAFERVGPDTVAKILFTSGSTACRRA